MAAVTICSDFGPRKIKSDTVSTVSPSISHEVMGPHAIDFLSTFPAWPSPHLLLDWVSLLNVHVAACAKLSYSCHHSFEL